MTRTNNGGGEDACLKDSSSERSENDQPNRIQMLNDQFRTTFRGGRVILTSGILNLGAEAISVISQRIKQYDNFTPDNDPYGEHDFGSFKHVGEIIYWKIDYYDNELFKGSIAPEDAEITIRILTIMLASEY